jgi:hypothetical protein
LHPAGLVEYNDGIDGGLQLARIWGIIRIKEKIAFDDVIEMNEANMDEALDTLCHKLDIPRPVVLKKHRSEFARFSRTRFAPDDFVESVSFACFELELLRDKKKNENERQQMQL